MDINFEQSTYTFSESDGTVDICAVTFNEALYDFDVGFAINVQVTESPSSATGMYCKLTFSMEIAKQFYNINT